MQLAQVRRHMFLKVLQRWQKTFYHSSSQRLLQTSQFHSLHQYLCSFYQDLLSLQIGLVVFGVTCINFLSIWHSQIHTTPVIIHSINLPKTIQILAWALCRKRNRKRMPEPTYKVSRLFAQGPFPMIHFSSESQLAPPTTFRRSFRQ